MRKLLRHLRFLIAVQLLPALESGGETLVGGQAVLEGVMMRSPHAWGISVRKPDGTISTHSEPLERLSEKHPWMGWPVVRGVMTLGQAMVLGFRALRYSADVALDAMPADAGEATKKTGYCAGGGVIRLFWSRRFRWGVSFIPNTPRGTEYSAAEQKPVFGFKAHDPPEP